MFTQRVLFSSFAISICFAAGIFGIYAGETFAIKIFGPEILVGPYGITSYKLWLSLISMCSGILICGLGTFFIIVLPLAFLFPNASRPIIKTTKIELAFLNWYAKNLQKYVDQNK